VFVTMNPTYLAFAALGLIWGTSFMLIKWASGDISASQIVFLRTLLGFLPSVAMAPIRGELKWRHLQHAPHFLVMSLLAAVANYAFAKGAALLRQERPTARMIAGIVSGFVGVLTIARQTRSAIGWMRSP